VRVILVVLVILGSVTAGVEIRRHVTNIVAAGTILHTCEMSQVTNLWDLGVKDVDSLVLQYAGSSQSPFFRFMVKRP
jgi:hypothetical protein